jgi:hypothetical protein
MAAGFSTAWAADLCGCREVYPGSWIQYISFFRGAVGPGIIPGKAGKDKRPPTRRIKRQMRTHKRKDSGMVANKRNKGAVTAKQTAPVAAAAPVGAVPTVMTTQEMDQAEGLVKRLEALDKSSMKDMRELLATVARTINLIRYCDSKGLLSPKAAYEEPAPAVKEKLADLPSSEDTAAEWRDMLLDHFKMASIEELLAGLLFEEIKLSSKDLFAEIRAIAVDRIRIAFKKGEIDSGDYDRPYCALNCIRGIRIKKLCPIWE